MMQERQYIRIKQECIGAAVLLLLLVLAGLCGSRQASAAGAGITVSTKQQNIQTGDTVYVVITVNSKTPMSGFEGYFSYDNRVLQFITGGSVVFGNDDEFQISDIERDSKSTTLKYSVKFRARKAGNTTIALKKPYNVYGESISEKMSVSYNALTVVVKRDAGATPAPVADTPVPSAAPAQDRKEPPEQTAANPPNTAKENTAQLSELSVAGVALSPEFAPDIYRYSGQIGTYDTKLSISYKTKEKGASVTVRGNKNLQIGKNIIKLVVTAGNHTKKTYRLTIKVTEPKPSAAPSNTEGVRAVSQSGGITLYGSAVVHVMSPDEEDIPKGFGKTELEIDGQVVEAYALESDTEHTYVLIYGKAGGQEQFYLYDRKENVLLPYAKVKAWYRSGAVGLVPEEEDALQVSNKRLKYVVGIVSAVAILFLLGIISLYMKYKGMDADEIRLTKDSAKSLEKKE